MNADAQDLILVDDVSYGHTESQRGMGGMRRRHIVRIGEPVDVAAWLMRVPAQSREDARCLSYCVGEGIQRHHLVMWWPCREAVRIVVGDWGAAIGAEAGTEIMSVMWRALSATLSTPPSPTLPPNVNPHSGEGRWVEETIRRAGMEYFAVMDRWPRWAAVAEDVVAPAKMSLGEGLPEVQIVAVGWVPKKCVVVL